MKPARSPRFQSAALRASSAVISAAASGNDAREAGSAGCAGCAAQAATAQSVRDHAPRTCASFNPGAGDDGSKMSRERREEMARATRTALPRGDVDGCERRRLLAAFFRLALGRRFALALGRFFAAFGFALG